MHQTLWGMLRYTSPQGAGNRLTKVQFDDLQEHTEQKHTSKNGFVTGKRLMDGYICICIAVYGARKFTNTFGVCCYTC